MEFEVHKSDARHAEALSGDCPGPTPLKVAELGFEQGCWKRVGESWQDSLVGELWVLEPSSGLFAPSHPLDPSRGRGEEGWAGLST